MFKPKEASLIFRKAYRAQTAGEKSGIYWVAEGLNTKALRKALVTNPGILQEEAWTSQYDTSLINFTTFIKKQGLLDDKSLQLIVVNSKMFKANLHSGDTRMFWNLSKFLDDLTTVEKWITINPYINEEIDAANISLKEFIVRNANIKLGSLLLKYSSKFNLFDGAKEEVMFFATLSGDWDKFFSVFQTTQDPHIKYPNNTTLLHLASYGGNPNIVAFLIAKGSKTDTVIKSTCIHQQEFDKDAKKGYGYQEPKLIPGLTELYLASSNGNLEVVKILLDFNVEINRKVHICEIVTTQDSHYFGMHKENKAYEYAPLDIASKYNRVEIVTELLQRGANGVETTLQLFHDNKQITKLLLDYIDNRDFLRGMIEGNYTAPDSSGSSQDDFLLPTSAKRASKYALDSEIKDLIQSRIESLIFLDAAKNSSILVLQASLYIGVNINSKLSDNSNALHLAAKSDNLDIINFLVEHGIDLEVRNRANMTPIEVAATHRKTKVVKLLLPHVKTPTTLQEIFYKDNIPEYIKTIIKDYLDNIKATTESTPNQATVIDTQHGFDTTEAGVSQMENISTVPQGVILIGVDDETMLPQA